MSTSANTEVIKSAVAELKTIAGQLSVSDLKTITDKAAANLVNLISQPDGVMATDPDLCLKAYVELSKAENAAVESRRRVVDTLIKAKSVIDPTLPPPAPNEVSGDGTKAPEITEEGQTSIFN